MSVQFRQCTVRELISMLEKVPEDKKDWKVVHYDDGGQRICGVDWETHDARHLVEIDSF